MGNGNTKSASGLEDAVREYASKYILRASFQDMVNMSNKNFCEELVILTSELLESKMSPTDIELIENMRKDNSGKPKRAKVYYATNMKVKTLMNDATKRAHCRGIAKYYVKVLNLFSAIVMTLDPQFKTSGSEIKLKDRRPVRDEQRISVSFSNNSICRRRFEALMKKKPGVDGNVEITNSVCGMNREVNVLGKEPGIPELERLYYDDEYDNETKRYTQMTKTMKGKYKEDLKRFYKTFTGKELDSSITKFSEVPLRDYNSQPVCQNHASGGRIVISAKEALFNTYATHLRTMMQTTEKYKNELLKILNDLFEEVNEPTSERKTYWVKKLTEAELDAMIAKARKLIFDMYATCESETEKGLKIFEAVIEAQTGEMNINRMDAPDKAPVIAPDKAPDNSHAWNETAQPDRVVVKAPVNAQAQTPTLTQAQMPTPTPTLTQAQTQSQSQTKSPTPTIEKKSERVQEIRRKIDEKRREYDSQRRRVSENAQRLKESIRDKRDERDRLRNVSSKTSYEYDRIEELERKIRDRESEYERLRRGDSTMRDLESRIRDLESELRGVGESTRSYDNQRKKEEIARIKIKEEAARKKYLDAQRFGDDQAKEAALREYKQYKREAQIRELQ